MVQSFEEFLELNEELNYNVTNDLIEFEDRWFYYDEDDEILYGCNEVPTDCLFSFNPVLCKTIYKDEEPFQYDLANPICVITLKMDNSNEFSVYTKNAYDFLKDKYHYNGTDVNNDRVILQKKLDADDEYRVIILYGKMLVASTFDIIEEN